MNNVIYTDKWFKKTQPENPVAVSIDAYIRSIIKTPPMGTIVFRFSSGKIEMTQSETRFFCREFELLLDGGELLEIIGSHETIEEHLASILTELGNMRGVSIPITG